MRIERYEQTIPGNWLILGSFPLYSHLCLSTALSYISTLLVTRKDFIFLMLMNQSSLTLNYKRFVLSRVEFCVMNSIINYTPHFQNIIKCWSLQMPLCDCLTTDVRAWMNCIREIDQNFFIFLNFHLRNVNFIHLHVEIFFNINSKGIL